MSGGVVARGLRARLRLDLLDFGARPCFDQLRLAVAVIRQHPVHMRVSRKNKILHICAPNRHTEAR